jgi:hypothetical protein
MTTPPTIFCEQDAIVALETTATHFFRDVLDLDYGSALVTDESDLSDFSFSGHMPPGAKGSSLKEEYSRWDAWVIASISKRYDVNLKTTRIKMVLLLSQIETSLRRTLQ